MTDLLTRIDSLLEGQTTSRPLTVDSTVASVARDSLRAVLYGGRQPQGYRGALRAVLDALGDEG